MTSLNDPDSFDPSQALGQAQVPQYRPTAGRPPAPPSGASTLVGDFLAPELADELRRVLGGAVIQGDKLIGGRTGIGAPISVFSKVGTIAGIVLFGWPYIIVLAQSLKNSWAFVPEAKVEFVRFSVAERVSPRRMIPIFALSIAFAVVTLLLVGTLAWATSMPLLMALGVLVAYFGMNTVAALGLKNPLARLQVSGVDIGYGFPNKVSLLNLQCDAPANELLPQLDHVANALNGFGEWNHVNVNGVGGVSVTLK